MIRILKETYAQGGGNMENESLELRAETAAVPADRNPAMVYLSNLAASGRAAVASRIKGTCKLMNLNDPALVRWESLRFQHLQAIKSKLLESNLSPSTINLTIHGLRGIAQACFNLGTMTSEDLLRLQGVKGVHSERLPAGRALSQVELKGLVSTCSPETVLGRRDLAILAVLYCGGLRRTELINLDLSDYNRETGELRVRFGKGRKERIVHLLNSSGRALENWLAVRGAEPGPLFLRVNKGGRILPGRLSSQAIYKMLKVRAEAAGIKTISPHDMRRTFISDLLDLGADISTVQKLAGHASVITTQRYDRRGEDAKRRASALLHLPVAKSAL